MYIFRVNIQQETAHYRIPFTYQSRQTYPLPPYSTVIGFLCNLLGIDDQRKEDYKKLRDIKMSIAGTFISMNTEFSTLRNLSKESHLDRFGDIKRDNKLRTEHPGGIVPCRIDFLYGVNLFIHLAHEDYQFLDKIKSSLLYPTNNLSPLRLGRSEDLITELSVSQIKPLSSLSIYDDDDNFEHFFWIPKKLYLPDNSGDINFDKYRGLSLMLPTFSKIEGYEETLNRFNKRIFEYIDVKLSEGIFKDERFLFDDEISLPIFLADFSKNN